MAKCKLSKTLDQLISEFDAEGDKRNKVPFVVLHEGDIVRLVVNGDKELQGRECSAKEDTINWNSYLFTIKRARVKTLIKSYLPLGIFLNSPYEGNGYSNAEEALLSQRGSDNAIFKNGLIREGAEIVKNLQAGVVVSEVFISEQDEKTKRVRRSFVFNPVKAETV